MPPPTRTDAFVLANAIKLAPHPDADIDLAHDALERAYRSGTTDATRLLEASIHRIFECVQAELSRLINPGTWGH